MENADWSKWYSKKNNFDKYKEVRSDLIYGALSQNIPHISIIIPTYNRSDILKQAIDSAVNQKAYSDYEILVIDNCSEVDQETNELMKHYTQKYSNLIYYRNEKNIGMFGNWNRSIELCRTEWLCLLHDDDMLKENYLQEVVPILDAGNKGCGILGVFHEKFDQRETENRKNFERRRNIRDRIVNACMVIRKRKPFCLKMSDMLNGISVMVCAAIYNREMTIELGGFDDAYTPNGDLVYFAKTQFYHGINILPDNLSVYRVGMNESMKKETCFNIVVGIFKLTIAMAETLHIPEKRAEKYAVRRALVADEIMKSYSEDYNFEEVCAVLPLSKKYLGRPLQRMMLPNYKLRWAAKLLL